MRFSVFRQIVSMGTVTLPVAGTLTNYDPLIAEGYAGKTGSDSAAGGCLAFFTHVTVAGRRLIAVGVVLGQGQGSNTSALLAAAAQAAEQLVGSVTPAIVGARSLRWAWLVAYETPSATTAAGSDSLAVAARHRPDVNPIATCRRTHA
jgi:D-alanyl-D-alanine carboxypeptidase